MIADDDPFDPRNWITESWTTITLDYYGDIFAMVDTVDLAMLRRFNAWCIKPGRNTLYARCYMRVHDKRIPFYMHRVILLAAGIVPPTSAHVIADHRNGNGLDNRRQNLRWFTHGDNAKNVHSYRQNLDLLSEVLS